MRPWTGLVIGIVAMVLIVLGGGCARYEYRIVEPADLMGVVPDEDDLTIPRPPLRYVFQDLDGLLAMAIVNEGERPVRLAGEQSYVVEPDGETHPLQGRLIAPGAHVSFAIPPQRERYTVYARPHPSPYYYDPLLRRRYYYPFAYGYGPYPYLYGYDPYPYPYAYDVYAPPTIYDWRWTTGPARLHLVFDPLNEDSDAMVHDFVIERVRVK